MMLLSRKPNPSEIDSPTSWRPGYGIACAPSLSSGAEKVRRRALSLKVLIDRQRVLDEAQGDEAVLGGCHHVAV